MNLNISEWKEFYLGKLFNIKKGKRLTSADQEDGKNNYIGAIDSNNGVANHIAQAPIHKGNTISLSYNGSVGEAFYQKEPYWATDDVNALYPYYENFNENIGLFITTVIRQEKYKFSYGRKWTMENIPCFPKEFLFELNNNYCYVIPVTEDDILNKTYVSSPRMIEDVVTSAELLRFEEQFPDAKNVGKTLKAKLFSTAIGNGEYIPGEECKKNFKELIERLLANYN